MTDHLADFLFERLPRALAVACAVLAVALVATQIGRAF